MAPARQFLTLILILAFLMLSFSVSAASETLPSEKSAAPPSAEQDYLAARQRFQATPDNAEAAVQLGRACFDAADAAASAGQRAQYAQEGIDACRKIITLNPKLVQGHYYLALNLGQLARTKSIGALKLVNQMETTLKHAIELDPAFDYAGPHRAIGLLYFDAPGWPVSVGSRSKARHHLQKAVELSPDYPENWIVLFEAYLRWDDHHALAAQLPAATEKVKAARQQFTGERWAAAWRDWNPRWEQIEAKTKAIASSSHSPKTQAP